MGKAHNVFISWSGARSRAVAEFLHGWLPKVIQATKPWLSSEDIDKGSRSQAEIATALEGIKVGVICLTPENLEEPWILFEAGALSKTVDDKTRLCTYLIGGLQPEDVGAPLGTFQATKAEKGDTRKLLQTINSALSDAPLSKDDLDDVFEAMWPKLKGILDNLPNANEPGQARRSLEDMVGEVLELTRGLTNSNRPPTALAASPARGSSWQELTLRRVVELSGMLDHCVFSERGGVAAESGPGQPDVIVNLPGNRRIAVDAKVSLQAFLDANDAEKSGEERAKSLATHARLVRAHMNQLAENRYWQHVGANLELVVLFLPGESSFSAALEQDRNLVDDGMREKVIIATPTTLIALLRSAAYLWQQEEIIRRTDQISALGRELHGCIDTFLRQLKKAGDSFNATLENHNKAVTTMESHMLPIAQRLKDLSRPDAPPHPSTPAS